ncbi:MAG TPA: Amuc_1100 family pilus-like protein, partial [Opitutaceae bacterium]|nr:Amuc_1100 family pilus-like protein [Opitutaceae bacterium]
ERLRAAKPPATRADAYFDLATFVERTRELAKKEGIEIRPEAERCGFSLYANEGPDVEHIEPVFRQRLVLEHVLGALFEAHARALLAVKRESPLSKRERDERDAALAAANGVPPADAIAPSATDDAGDFFAIDPRASVRAPGFLDATAFRVTFIGQTAALRTFLNRLAAFELPLLVREVQVEPATFEEPAPASPEETAASENAKSTPASVVLTAEAPARKPPAKKSSRRLSTAAPIVAKPFSKFTVTLECIELVSPADNSATPPAEKPTT